MTLFHFTIATPDRHLFDGDIEHVTLPTTQGEITILAHHEPLIAVVVPGEMIVRQNGQDQIFAVSKGSLEVRDNSAVVLATTTERLEEIDEQRAQDAKQKAQTLMQGRIGEEEYAETAALLERNLVRLRLVHKHRTRHMPHVD